MIQITHDYELKPQKRYCCTLNVISDSTLVLHGGALRGGNHRYQTSSDTWILDLSTQTWRQYKYMRDHSRDSHKGITGLNSCVIITCCGKHPLESYDDYTTIFHIMLAPKSLQQLAMQSVFKHRDVPPWKWLPSKLQTCLGLTESEQCARDENSYDICN